MVDRERLQFATAAEWEQWLEQHFDDPAYAVGVGLVISKKGSPVSTLAVVDALDVALSFGWIDGVRNAIDEHFFLQSYMPRRPRSMWSQINRDKVAALIAAGRMRPSGQNEIDRAKADGRWDAAYAGSKSIEVPDDLAAAIAASPAAAQFFPTLSSQNRFAILFRIGQAKRPETRQRNIEKFVAQLERGETIYPQKEKPRP
jgi:uncharacterized protein YdeI (YjbR/CyaY-like superfamily)